MKKEFFLTFCLGFLLVPRQSYTQSEISHDSIHLSLFTEYIYSDSINEFDSLPILKFQIAKAIIQINGSGNLEKVQGFEIALGSSEGSSDLLFYEFLFDKTIQLPNGLGFYRDRNLIVLTLGKDIDKRRKYCKLRIRDTDDQFTLPIFN